VVVLADLHGIQATYCHGNVFSTAGPTPEMRLEDHCWLEVGGETDHERLIIDLTCDQSDYFEGVQVLCDSYRELSSSRAVEYRRDTRMASDALDTDLQSRLDILVKAIGQGSLPVIPERWAKLF
jgi:hypothetical protein